MCQGEEGASGVWTCGKQPVSETSLSSIARLLLPYRGEVGEKFAAVQAWKKKLTLS